MPRLAAAIDAEENPHVRGAFWLYLLTGLRKRDRRKRLMTLGALSVLDDVLMSVDAVHRREVSRMLKHSFPNTQFILTTHDDIWLKHMKSVGLIEPSAFVQFRTWDVQG